MAAALDIAALPDDPATLRALLIEALAERDGALAERDALEAQNDKLRLSGVGAYETKPRC